jgi:hypothetical protein
MEPVANMPIKIQMANIVFNGFGQLVMSSTKKLMDKYAAAAFGFTNVPMPRFMPDEVMT